MSQSSVLRPLSLFALGMILPACSSGGGSSTTGFQLTRISLENNEVLKVNQSILFTFNMEVDFSTVSLNTISIQTFSGTPATGTFFMPTGRNDQVVFQPSCPILPDLSDTGFIAGDEPYLIRVLGQSSGAANTVRAVGGAPLEISQVRNFITDEADAQFLDTRAGGPAPVVRDEGASDRNATYLEVGPNDDRVYFELTPQQSLVLVADGSADFEADFDGTAPLNLFSDPASRIAFVVEFNQPVFPSAANLNPSRLRIEYEDDLGDWIPLETNVSLTANCTEAGARVRLEPVGILPAGRPLRAHVLAGLQDLVGEPGAEFENIAVLPARTISFPSLDPTNEQSDELVEGFEFGGSSSRSLEDTEALFDLPPASWGGGQLTAAFDFFEGDDCLRDPDAPPFNVRIENGRTLLVDTDGSTILNEDETMAQDIAGSGPRAGVIDVHDLIIEPGARVRVQGSNPLRINATGVVVIDGILDASGFDARDVETVNTGDQEEVGAKGGPGGGDGGNANGIVTNSTPQGGFGQGPLDEINRGGQGGESGFAPFDIGKEARRPGGGAGGRFALDQGLGLRAEAGKAGSSLATSAITPMTVPQGGVPSPGPFVDGLDNNFFGTRALGAGGNVIDLIRGELPSLWGGYGGGGGGNAMPATMFPTPNWTPASDEKGGAGGGGGGAIHVRALGAISFGVAGLVKCDGGRGARGENVLIQDHIGGSGGSGSGGHVVLETATGIITPKISAVGGAKVTGFGPQELSGGGAGGPGVVQLHVPNPLTPPAGITSTPPAVVLVPSYGGRSQARSKWISIGAADQPTTGQSLLRFLFQGTDAEGKVEVEPDPQDPDFDRVRELDPLLDLVLAGNGAIEGRDTLRVDDAAARFPGMPGAITNDIYLRNPALLEDFVLRFRIGAGQPEEFVVAAASYDDGTQQLRLVIADEGSDLQPFASAPPGTVFFELVPRFFRVGTCDRIDRLPVGSFVRIRFEAAGTDLFGNPAPLDPPGLATDIADFNTLAPGDLQFFRFEVDFDLGPIDADTQSIRLDFLRIPFVF